MSNKTNQTSVIVDDSAVKRIQELRAAKNQPTLKLRITIDSGGCSGFQYVLKLDDAMADDDHVFADAVVTDDISMAYLAGSTVSFAKELAGSEFKIDNPNAVSGCGCGSSFSMG